MKLGKELAAVKAVFLLLTLLFASGCGPAGTTPPETSHFQDWRHPTLRELSRAHGFSFGTAGSVEPWYRNRGTTREELSDPRFLEFARLHFDHISSGQNYLPTMVWRKPSDVGDRRTYRYSKGSYKFAEITRDFTTKGTHMIWHSSVPEWMNRDFSGPEVELFMNTHIEHVLGEFPDIDEWNVVNEALKHTISEASPDNAENLRDTVWKRNIDGNFVVKAFERARSLTDKKLFYNDYGVCGGGPKADAMFDLVSELKELGLIDGVGLQCHLHVGDRTTRAKFLANFARFSDLGIEVHVSEFDILGCNSEQHRAHDAPRIIGEILPAFIECENCTVFTFWGITNDLSWVHPDIVDPGMAEGLASTCPLPFNKDYEPEPMFFKIVEILGG